MPTVRAADYPYQAFPSQQPSTSVPTSYQDMRAPIEAFGGATGEALSRLGATFERASERLGAIALERQELQNRIVADQQISSFENSINKVMYGDPDVPGDVGYMGLKGQAAMDQRAPTRAKIDQVLADHRRLLQNPHQTLAFDTQTRRYRNMVLNEVGRKYDSEMNRWATETTQARASVALSNAGIASNNDDFAAWKSAFGTGRATLIENLSNPILGHSKEFVDAKVREFDEKAVTDWAVKLATRDPVKANEFVDANREYLPTQYDNVKRAVKAESEKALATEIATGAKAPRGTPDLVRGGATGNAVERFLDLAEKEESGNKNIEQNVVPPQGGYNPSVGRVTGPSTASGHFQITDTTWRNFAPAAGVDLAEYPRAIRAPYEVQRKVARYIATTDGVQHWTNFNAKLRDAVRAEGLPLAGPVKGVTQEPVKEPDVLLANLPEKLPGEVPDTDLGADYRKQLEEAAKRVPEGTPITVWHQAVKMLRQRYNERYVDQRRAEQTQAAEQKKKDETLQDGFLRRFDSPNPPSISEILQSDMSVAAKENMWGIATRLAQPGPTPRVSAANMTSLFARMDPEYAGEDAVRSEAGIDDAFKRGEITWDARRELINNFRDRYSSTNSERAKAEADVIKSLRVKLRPSLALRNGELIEQHQDPSGPDREVLFKRFVTKQVNDAARAGKDPLTTVLNPESPEYVGKQIERFTKGGPNLLNKVNEGNQSFVEPKSLADVQAQYRAGKFGTPGSKEASDAAYAEALRRGFVKPRAVEVPVR